MVRILTAILTLCTSWAAAREVGLDVGMFKFEATDYYYPNFYDEGGFRGEINYILGETWRHNLRAQFYGYPGDDNIFETIIEYGPWFEGGFRGFVAETRPCLGFDVMKFQYPAPYYPTITHQYLPWLRGGYDVAVGHLVAGPVWLYAGDRGRAMFYFASGYAAFQDDRWVWSNAPFGEVRVHVGPNWTLRGRGGVEFGGYYDDVFLTPDYLPHARPFGEVGATMVLP